MKNRIIALTTILLVLFLAGCGPQVTPEYVEEGPERDSIIADTDVFARTIQDGLESKDFALFSSDFDSGMLGAVNEDAFLKMSKQFEPYGKSTSMELVNVQKDGEYFAVRYKVTYPEKIIIMRVVVNNLDPRQVSGLWFE